jgi:hypothetical protein
MHCRISSKSVETSVLPQRGGTLPRLPGAKKTGPRMGPRRRFTSRDPARRAEPSSGRGWGRTSDLWRVRRSTLGPNSPGFAGEKGHRTARSLPSSDHEFQRIPWDSGQRPTPLAPPRTTPVDPRVGLPAFGSACSRRSTPARRPCSSCCSLSVPILGVNRGVRWRVGVVGGAGGVRADARPYLGPRCGERRHGG